MSAHTPGPWTAGDLYADDCGQPEIAIHANVNGVTCYPAAVCLQFPSAAGMQLANAYVIAAAPDLLAACKAFMTYRTVSELDSVVVLMNAAIAKAEGGAA